MHVDRTDGRDSPGRDRKRTRLLRSAPRAAGRRLRATVHAALGRQITCRMHVVTMVTLTVVLVACAPRTVAVPPMPTMPRHPEFLFPAVPPAQRGTLDAERIDRGWRYLQNDDLRSATREFGAALRRNPAFYPAHAGEGYVALARRDYSVALAAFDTALRSARNYAPALVGRGQVMLALGRDSEALAAFEAALEADSSLSDVQRRVEVLRFRNLQETIDGARRAAGAGRLDEARAAYERALAASPDSAFLHRELGMVERRRNNTDAALEHFGRASELDPFDAESLVQIGEIREGQQDFAAAEDAYRRAAQIEPSAELNARLAAVSERARDTALPAEFAAIPGATPITRGELAALISVRLDAVLRAAPERQVVLTDVNQHWAADWITAVARAGVMDPFPNHSFEPREPVRRVDLAMAVSRLVRLLAPRHPQLAAALTERPGIADVSTRHLNYPEVAVAVASGLMQLREGQVFDATRPVTGAEAVDTIGRIQALARSR